MDVRIDPSSVERVTAMVLRHRARLGYVSLQDRGRRKGEAEITLARLDIEPDTDDELLVEVVSEWVEEECLKANETRDPKLRVACYGPKGGYLQSCALQVIEATEDDDLEGDDPKAYMEDSRLAHLQQREELLERRNHAVFERALLLTDKSLGLVDRLTGALSGKDEVIESLTTSRFVALDEASQARAEAASKQEQGELAERVVEKITDTALTVAVTQQGLPAELASLAGRADVLEALKNPKVQKMLAQPDKLKELLQWLPAEEEA